MCKASRSKINICEVALCASLDVFWINQLTCMNLYFFVLVSSVSI